MIVVLIDMELYRNWGFRMDKTPLLYLRTPGEAMASTPVWMTIAFGLGIILASWGCYFVYKRYVNSFLIKSLDHSNPKRLFLLVLIGVLIFPIRGGLGVAVLNASAVYFHTEPFVNHAAINVVWNVGYSLTTPEKEKSYHYFESNRAKEIFKSLHPKGVHAEQLIKTNRPNIILLIVESFSAQIIEPLEGMPGVSPNFSQLCKEGVLFEHFYANGDRSDKGIVSVMSGYPAQPTTSIIKYPGKTRDLPFLSQELEKLGYSTAFYYGGDLNFANMRTYFVTGGFDKLVTLEDFPDELATGKWGVHDEYVFSRLLRDIDQSDTPFFKSMFTLSNHEPFDVPMSPVFHGSGEEQKFKNSAFYTDRCLGNFIQEAKTKPWWDNTLVLIMADHGSRLPGNIKQYEEEKFRIPMLWLGGALLQKDTIISTYSSQIDVSKTLLGQLGIAAPEFTFGKDIFAQPAGDFAFFVFNDGFGFAEPDFTYIHGNVADTTIYSSGIINTENKNKGKAYLQVLMEDYLGREGKPTR